MQRLIKGRINKLGICVILLLSLLVGRLVQVQLISTESFTDQHINLIEASVKQRTQSLVIDEGRGRFIDRNGLPLTHDYFPSVILFPFLNGLDWPKEELAGILQMNASEIDRLLVDADKPVVLSESLTDEKMEQINELDYPGIVALYRQFELDEKIAEHVIGLTGEDVDTFMKRYADKVEKENYSPHTPIGVSGLEEAFDEIILPEGSTKLLYHVDRFGGPLFGIDVRYMSPSNPYYPLTVQTTLDRNIQQLAEKTLNEYQVKKGGLVVIDIETNEVIAMVSKPSLDHENPSKGAGAHNFMLEPHFPGSVFKTVVTAAAIEENVVDNEMVFNCDLDIRGNLLEDEKKRMGTINLETSFSQSCNYTFGEIGKQLAQKDNDALDKYAAMLGLKGTVGWKGDMFGFDDFVQIPSEKENVVWDNDEDKGVPLAVAQTSIGQKDVKVTPLAVANMMATIARGGESKEVKLVSDILYKNGTTLFTFPEHERDVDKLSSYTVMQLQHLLREVVEGDTGTGWRMKGLSYEVAGKSGTAQTGKFTEDGPELLNRWFAGYFPIQSPKYAMVMVELDVVDENNVSSVYSKMVQEIYNLENQER
ncbi:peptidoglycan D,D-transpeptidase FtsI family protein [Sutcliffiella horikoshii]|uniref:serine-type D-Ala-D-Ala carboxypeptidase n=1 Tax=Sutcliffiella horikoshii TaxID=79883 RepID=A0A5D4T6F1_9BACI|nr:penicillin-binding transpeptidase domain-containing protein [Sutcliffiella horikoshii]TYS71300.1 penicillin-binding protein 2 [Sutcliffiella horikoshii]